jgi:hypothetical protein
MTLWPTRERRWTRPGRSCPSWCGRGHYCTIPTGAPGSAHRSAPLILPVSWGRLVVTRVQGIADTTSRLEVRLAVTLPATETAARTAAEALATEIDASVRVVLGVAGVA